MPRPIASVQLIAAALALIGCAQEAAPPAATPPPPQGVYVPGFGPETRPRVPSTTAEPRQTAPTPTSVP